MFGVYYRDCEPMLSARFVFQLVIVTVMVNKLVIRAFIEYYYIYYNSVYKSSPFIAEISVPSMILLSFQIIVFLRLVSFSVSSRTSGRL